MAQTSATSPGTMADDATVGTVAWSNPDNAKADDDNYAVCDLANGEIGHYLKATNFGFSISSGATINGILVEMGKLGSGNNTVYDSRVRIIKGGVIGSTDKADATNWPAPEQLFTYGTSSDLWGESWMVNDINATDFGVVISPISTGRDAAIDYIRITVYYTIVSPFPSFKQV